MVRKTRVLMALTASVAVFVLGSGGSALAASVTIGVNFYSPSTVTIQVGDSVTWSYTSGDTIHSVLSDQGLFDSSPGCPGNPSACMSPGDSYTHTFSSAGTFPYHCAVHGFSMAGTVIVQSGPPPTGGSQPPLPNTGAASSTGPFIWIGLALLVGGAALLLLARRRRA